MPTAIVTGAGSGIGKAAALKLASMRYSLVLAGRTKSTLDAVAQQITATSGQALVVPTDVSKSADVERLIHRAVDHFKSIDVLVNNAGYAPAIPTAELSEKQWQAIIDTNLSSAFHATRLAWPIMKKQNAGVIVNISSMAARDPFPSLGAYAAAKAALNMLTLATAREGAPFGIRVVGIAPAGVDTPMFRNLVGEANVNTEEILRPEDVADAIAAAVESQAGSLRFASGETVYLHRKPA